MVTRGYNKFIFKAIEQNKNKAVCYGNVHKSKVLGSIQGYGNFEKILGQPAKPFL